MMLWNCPILSQRIEWVISSGGEGGIRTPETLAGLRAFQARALGHYATSPAAGTVSKIMAF